MDGVTNVVKNYAYFDKKYGECYVATPHILDTGIEDFPVLRYYSIPLKQRTVSHWANL